MRSPSSAARTVLVAAVALVLPGALAAQEPCIGDVFGDLVHVLRDPDTGQPILAQRWIELPAEIPGYGWGYCPIATGPGGEELAFLPYSCDVADPTAVVEVDYFGRLNAGRTRERNIRMHFDETIDLIQSSDWVDSDGSARLRLWMDCLTPGNPSTCASSSVVDSPMANLALFARLVKYGTLQTDPLEVDTDDHGDPTDPITYHPALGASDWSKFANRARHLLPGNGMIDCFGGGTFLGACAEPELLDSRDLVRAAGFVGGGADKSGRFTADLVQYLGRILNLTKETETTLPTIATLPALVRDCWPGIEDPPSPAEDDPAPVDPPYLPPAECEIDPADAGLPNFAIFPDVQERFVDFSPIDYDREEWRDELVEVILPVSTDLWHRVTGLSLLPYLLYRNGPDGASNLPGFVLAANDALRWIEFMHNYEVPADLFADVDPLIFADGFESGDTSSWSETLSFLAGLLR